MAFLFLVDKAIFPPINSTQPNQLTKLSNQTVDTSQNEDQTTTIPNENVNGMNVNTATEPELTVVPTTGASSMAYDIPYVIERAAQFDGESVCVYGWYQSSFEFSAFGSGSEFDANGNRRLVEPYVAVEKASPNPDTLICTGSERGAQDFCLGEVSRFCGIFRVAPAGQPGYGINETIRYAIK